MRFEEAEKELKEACKEINGEFKRNKHPDINLATCTSPVDDEVSVGTDFGEPRKAKADAILISEKGSEGKISSIKSIEATSRRLEVKGEDEDTITLEGLIIE